MIALLLRLYPARWRKRYGDEFAALLAERPLGPFDVADVLLGALDAYLHLRGQGAASASAQGFAMSLRIGGYAAIAGGILWLVLLAGNAINDGAESGGTILGWVAVAAVIVTLVALVGLSAFQARRHPVLTWAAFIIPAGGGIVALLGVVAGVVLGSTDGLIGGVSAWTVMSTGLIALLMGSALFALATWRTRSLSRPGAALLGFGSLVVVPALSGVVPGAGVLAALPVVIVIVAFPAGWIALGVSALRAGPATYPHIEGVSP